MSPRKFVAVLSYIPIYGKINRTHLNVVAAFLDTLLTSYPDARALLYIANDDSLLSASVEFGNWRQKYIDAAYEEKLRGLLAAALSSEVVSRLDIKVEEPGRSLLDCRQALMSYEPSCAFFWGGIYEARNLRRACYGVVPIAFMFFNVNNRVDTSVDLYLSRYAGQRINGPHDPEKISSQPGAVSIPDVDFSYPAEYVRADEAELVAATVISGDRLQKAFESYSATTFDQLAKLFDEHQNLKWHFIGPGDLDGILDVHGALRELYENGRLIIRRREAHLQAFFRHVDLYVHLPGLAGGGGGVSMARKQAVATICYAGSDACGAQLPAAIYEREDAFFAAISRYLASKEDRIELGIAVRDYMLSNFNAHAVAEALRANIEKAVAIFKQNHTLASEPNQVSI